MKFEIIYADPPQAFRNKRVGGSLKSGAEQQYDIMSDEEIINLSVKDIVADNAYIFLWCSGVRVAEGLHTKIMEAWGFRPVNIIVWDKKMIGMGSWFRNQTEYLVFGKRGNVKPFHLTSTSNLFSYSRAGYKHSEKPWIFRAWINDISDKMFGEGCYHALELFARNDLEWKYHHWEFVGNEVCDEDIRKSIERLKSY